MSKLVLLVPGKINQLKEKMRMVIVLKLMGVTWFMNSRARLKFWINKERNKEDKTLGLALDEHAFSKNITMKLSFVESIEHNGELVECIDDANIKSKVE